MPGDLQMNNKLRKGDNKTQTELIIIGSIVEPLISDPNRTRTRLEQAKSWISEKSI